MGRTDHRSLSLDGRQEKLKAGRQQYATGKLLLPTMSGQVTRTRSSGNKLIKERENEGIFQKSKLLKTKKVVIALLPFISWQIRVRGSSPRRPVLHVLEHLSLFLSFRASDRASEADKYMNGGE